MLSLLNGNLARSKCIQLFILLAWYFIFIFDCIIHKLYQVLNRLWLFDENLLFNDVNFISYLQRFTFIYVCLNVCKDVCSFLCVCMSDIFSISASDHELCIQHVIGPCFILCRAKLFVANEGFFIWRKSFTGLQWNCTRLLKGDLMSENNNSFQNFFESQC